MNSPYQLTDGLIVLRPPTKEDIPVIYAAVRESLPQLHPWMDWATDAYDESSAQRWFEFAQLAWDHSSAFQFVIFDIAKGQYLGGCGVDGINEKNGFCNLGYWVRTSRTGQGIATRAARLAARFAFQTIGLLRAEIVIAKSNLASQHVAQKAGAHYDGVLKNRMVVRRDVYDAVMYSFSPADFENHTLATMENDPTRE